MSTDYRAHLRQRLIEREIPETLHEGLIEYLAARRPTGSFLQCVLENNFRDACLRADDINRWHLADLAMFLCHFVPDPAWGSPAKVAAWLADPNPVPEIFEQMAPLDFDLSAPCEITGSARFSRDGTLRNEIRRWWVKEPKRWAGWLMTNPSKAGKDRNDPTALRVTHFSREFGCDGWIGVNLYPFISSTPAEMWRWANWEAHGPAWDVRDDLLANLRDIEEVARLSTLRMVAFGAAPVYHDEAWLEQCLEAFGQPADSGDNEEQFYCLGVNSTGQPLHPLARGKMRVPDNQRPIPWTR